MTVSMADFSGVTQALRAAQGSNSLDHHEERSAVDAGIAFLVEVNGDLVLEPAGNPITIHPS